MDREHRVVLANRMARDLAGRGEPVPRSRTCGRAVRRGEAANGEYVESCPLGRVAATKVPVTVERIHSDALGNDTYWEISAAPIFDEAGGGVQLIELCRDVTQRNQLENELAQAHKLESVGQLAAGIAHEIHTPIQYIGDNARFLQDAFCTLDKLFDVFDGFFQAAKG